MTVTRRRFLQTSGGFAAQGFFAPYQLMGAGSGSGGGGGGTGLLLDSLSATSAVAYSTRKLRSAYAGSAIRVYESGGGTQQDIGFDGSGNLDTAALAAFVGANDGYIAKLYDQSGNGTFGVDAIEASPTVGARIRIAGVTQTMNGHACWRYINGTTNASGTPNWKMPNSLAQPDTHAAVLQYTEIATGGFVTDTDGTGVGRQFFRPGTVAWTMFAGSVITGGAADTSLHGNVVVMNGASSVYYVDNTSQATGDAGANAIQNQTFSQNAGGFNGFLCEYVLFTSALGATDRSTMRTNWNTYWGTP